RSTPWAARSTPPPRRPWQASAPPPRNTSVIFSNCTRRTWLQRRTSSVAKSLRTRPSPAASRRSCASTMPRTTCALRAATPNDLRRRPRRTLFRSHYGGACRPRNLHAQRPLATLPARHRCRHPRRIHRPPHTLIRLLAQPAELHGQVPHLALGKRLSGLPERSRTGE